MSIRPEVSAVLDGLGTPAPAERDEAIRTARFLLEKTAMRFADAEAERRAYEAPLPKELRDLKLTAPEIDAMTAALLGLLDGPPHVQVAAAWALGRCGRLAAVPALLELLRGAAMVARPTGLQLDIIGQVAYSLEDLLELIEPERPFTPEERGLIADVRSLLGAIAARLPDDDRGAGHAAQTAQQGISHHFRAAFGAAAAQSTAPRPVAEKEYERKSSDH